MIPPGTINVIDPCGGFTAVTRQKTWVRDAWGGRWEWRDNGTLWRPGYLLRDGSLGSLVGYDEKSFYQNNNNVTQAIYKVPGYGYKIAVWFDNTTGRRIA